MYLLHAGSKKSPDIRGKVFHMSSKFVQNPATVSEVILFKIKTRGTRPRGYDLESLTKKQAMWQTRANLRPLVVNAKRFVRRCFSSKVQARPGLGTQLEEQSLHHAPSDVFLVCDTNLVIDYEMACKDDPGNTHDLVSGWRKYADKVAAHGETCIVLGSCSI